MEQMRNTEILGLGLSTLKNKTTQLKDLLMKDKINLLVFYHTNCLGCTGRALPFGYELSKEHKNLNFIVIHVNFASRKMSNEEVLSVFTDQTAPFEIWLDEGAQLYEALDCEGTPHWIFMDDQGEVKHSIFGSQEGAKMKIHFAIDEELS